MPHQHIKPKRKRATPFQATRLEEVLQQTHFPSTELRLELARELGMTPRTVQIWFQNRRQAHRAERKRMPSMRSASGGDQGGTSGAGERGGSASIGGSSDGRSGDEDDLLSHDGN
ncbi:Homeodomain-like protein [Myxozyma melibiosi]|uniref:Homeodomain-like protein n=1 Tax=Myxozyma melibiosi TaxID=54550 RepID=A0ABR1F3U0_9ASCO